MSAAPGDQQGEVLLGKYRVERTLGRGGMGVVLAVRHIELGELFAMKFLLPGALESANAEDRFLREARATARLKGEHIARVYDVGRLDSGALYMVMEYLDGIDLKALIKARGPIGADEASTLIRQACEALDEAHAIGIIHRDIKPANLFLIRRPDGSPCVKVIDFGISKCVEPGAADLTIVGTLLGSPLYMSPEQITRLDRADARTDVWSLGVVLYELVTGVTPFAAPSFPAIIARVRREDPPPPSRIRPGLSGALDAAVERSLQKLPEHRFQSVRELMAALDALTVIRALSDRAVGSPPPAERSEKGPEQQTDPITLSRTSASPLTSSQPGGEPAGEAESTRIYVRKPSRFAAWRRLHDTFNAHKQAVGKALALSAAVLINTFVIGAQGPEPQPDRASMLRSKLRAPSSLGRMAASTSKLPSPPVFAGPIASPPPPPTPTTFQRPPRAPGKAGAAIAPSPSTTEPTARSTVSLGQANEKTSLVAPPAPTRAQAPTTKPKYPGLD